MKVAVVTGVSSGIGKAISGLLLQAGWKVYGLSRTRPKIKNDNLVWLQIDLADASAITKSLDRITETTVDLLVSNAGVAFQELPTKVTTKSYQRMFSVNVLAPMLLVGALKEKLTTAVIISISSVSDRLIEKELALYCSSKAANTRYFEAVADELTGARVVTLLPDYVDTPMLQRGEGGDKFNWDDVISVGDLAQFTVDLAGKKYPVPSGSNIIIVTNALVDDLEYREKLYGFNTDTKQLKQL